MKNRRNFLKSALSVVVNGIILSSSANILAKGAGSDLSVKNKDVYPDSLSFGSGITWRSNIFCQFEHEDLKAAIEKCALDTDCTLTFGEYESDILAVPSFVIIVDRNVLGHQAWRDYVACYEHNVNDVPCFMVDQINDLPFPKQKYVYQLDLNDKSTIPLIVTTIKEMRASMDKGLPNLFRKVDMIRSL
jgi:hypothetical protein